MKYSVNSYAKALAEVVGEAKGEAAQKAARNFIGLIRKNGDEARLRKILEEAARLLRGKHGIRKLTLEAARPLGKAQRELLKPFIKAGDVVEEEIDPELIAGVRIIVDDEQQFDGSLRGKLDKLFSK